MSFNINYRKDFDGIVPEYKTEGAAAADLSVNETYNLKPWEKRAFGTGIYLEIPKGFEGQIRPRSSMFLKHGIFIPFGTIDSDYRGEIKIVLANFNDQDVLIEYGDRVAQLVIAPVMCTVKFVEQMALSETDRGDGGFGSTGK